LLLHSKRVARERAPAGRRYGICIVRINIQRRRL
jgi:hypothetical protein